MKNNFLRKALLGLLTLVLAIGFSSCHVHHSHHHHKTVVKRKPVPPGHLKKYNGSKSAKHYTPGHRKKR
jgi:hypothetical protein